jgi:diaminopimelate epimerase
MPMNIPFTKMHGLGNDFILIEEDQLPAELKLSQLAADMCDRHFGIGADGLIVVAPPDTLEADIQFKIYNADGSQPEMCGNGIRCFARYVKDQGLVKQHAMKIQTLAGPIIPIVNPDHTVRVDMGAPVLDPEKIPFLGQTEAPVLHYSLPVFPQGTIPIAAVSMGNPHCIVFQDELAEALNHVEWGPLIEKHELFPAKTNVHFIEIENRHTIHVKVWERGAGATLACGTGACAVGVASILRKLCDSPITVNLPGGPLIIEWDGHGHVFMTGPATYVFAGMFPFERARNPVKLLNS